MTRVGKAVRGDGVIGFSLLVSPCVLRWTARALLGYSCEPGLPMSHSSSHRLGSPVRRTRSGWGVFCTFLHPTSTQDLWYIKIVNIFKIVKYIKKSSIQK